MMSVLDMLQRRLGGGNWPPSDRTIPGTGAGPSSPPLSEADRRLQAMGPVPPSYLPEAVWDSLLNKRTYGEGEVIPGNRVPPRPPETILPSGHPDAREFQLNRDIGFGNYLRQQGTWPMEEGDFGTMRPPGQSPFASPLNQLMQLGRRAPLAMY